MPVILSQKSSWWRNLSEISPFNSIVWMSSLLGALMMAAFFQGQWVPVAVVAFLPFLFYGVAKNTMLVFLIWIGSTPILSNFVSIYMGAGIPDITINRVAVSLLFMVMIVKSGMGIRRMKRIDAVEWTGIIIIVLVVPGLANSFYPLQASQQIFDGIVTPFIIYSLARNLIRTKDEIRPLIWTLGIVTLYSATFGFFEHFTEKSLFTRTGSLTWVQEGMADRIQGPFPSGGALGTIMVGGVVFFLYLFINQRKLLIRVFATTVLLIHSMTIFWSYRRSVWMGFAATVIFLMMFEKRLRQILIWIMVLGAGIAALNWEGISRSTVYEERVANVRTVNDRYVIWMTTWEIVKKYPLFGCGYNNFGYYYQRNFTFFGPTVTTDLARDARSPHNSYLRWWVEGGAPVTIAYLILLGIMAVRTYRLLRGRLKHPFVEKMEVMVFMGLFTTQYVQALTTDMVFFTRYPAIMVFLLAGVLSHAAPAKKKSRAINVKPRRALPVKA